MVSSTTVAQFLEDRELFWNEYVRCIPQVPEDDAKIRSFVDRLHGVIRPHSPPISNGLLLQKRESFWILHRDDGCPQGKIHERLFESYIRPALSHFAYLCHGRIDGGEEYVQLTFLEPCESDPRFQDKQAFWTAYLAIMKRNGLVVDDTFLPCIDRIYLELFAAKHASGSLFFERGEDAYVLWDTHQFAVGSLPFDVYEQYVQPALSGFCEISKARWTQMDAGDLFSYAPR